MVGKSSAGLLLYRICEAAIEVLLVHPGGPYWKNKDESAWSIPKGEFLPEEDPLAAARREFFEETGVAIEGELRALKPLRQPGGKIVHAWAVDADLDPATIVSNTFETRCSMQSWICSPKASTGICCEIAPMSLEFFPSRFTCPTARFDEAECAETRMDSCTQ